MNMKEHIPQRMTNHSLNGRRRDSEKGAVLLVVIVLSAIALAIMTTLIYMITVGAQITGVEKRYRTAHDASFGGWEIMSQLLATRGSVTAVTPFTTSLNAAGLSSSVTVTATCRGTTDDGQMKYGIEAKLMTSSTTWSPECGLTSALSASSYDFHMQLGEGLKYDVYGKIINTVQGNTGGETAGGGIQATGTVNTTSGVITVVAVPYMYTVDVEAENAANTSERAKLSVLYQY